MPISALSGSREGLDGESDAFGFKVSAEDLDLDDLAGFDGLGRLLDKAVGELADVDQTVLVDAYVHEGSKLGDVGLLHGVAIESSTAFKSRLRVLAN
jgi:hypothetical protein